MAMVSWYIDLLIFIATVILCYYIYFKKVSSKYWKIRNVPHHDPVFLLGTVWKSGLITNFALDSQKWHMENKDNKMIGMWFFTFPSLMITDLEIIKNVLVRDFNYFHDRGININEEKDPLMGHLFNLNGTKWRNLRVKLTPTFTSGKMKMMFPAIVECGEELGNYLKNIAEKEETIEFKDLLARFTTDVISSCAFGLQTNSIQNPNSEFREHGKKIFEPSFMTNLINNLQFMFPNIFNRLPVHMVPKEVNDFFMKVVKETVDYRVTNNVKRNDFMQLLIELVNKGKIEDADSKYQNEEEKDAASSNEQKFTLNQAAAQAFVFFLAGFETSSTTLTFALYELALNPDIQVKLQKDIDRVLSKHSNKVTYEAVSEMDYLDWVIQETLRKYPPIPVLIRECTKDYEIPNMNVKFDKGTSLMISVLGLQNDPEFYPNPDKFDPNRFSPEEKSQRDHFLHLPFGEGPRNCIGNRFALAQTKVGLISILSKYNVEVAKDTPIPMEYDKMAFVLTPVHGMPLKVTLRK